MCLIALAGVCTALVGMTRIYLGVHWASDVVGGWLAGTIWAAASWTIVEMLQLRGTRRRTP